MKNLCSILTSKGQITIPAYIRDKLHLSVGSKLEFIIYNNSFLVVPINKSVKDLQGILPKPKKSLTLEEMDESIRGGYDRA